MFQNIPPEQLQNNFLLNLKFSASLLGGFVNFSKNVSSFGVCDFSEAPAVLNTLLTVCMSQCSVFMRDFIAGVNVFGRSVISVYLPLLDELTSLSWMLSVPSGNSCPSYWCGHDACEAKPTLLWESIHTPWPVQPLLKANFKSCQRFSDSGLDFDWAIQTQCFDLKPLCCSSCWIFRVALLESEPLSQFQVCCNVEQFLFCFFPMNALYYMLFIFTLAQPASLSLLEDSIHTACCCHHRVS